MRLGRELGADQISRPDRPAGRDDAHDAGLADQLAVLVAVQHRRHQPRLERVELHARVAHSGDLDDGGHANVQPRTRWQTEQIDPTGGEVLTQVAGADPKSGGVQFVVELGVNQVYLAKIGLGRVARDSRTMLDRPTHVCVAFDAEAGQQADAVPRRLAECVPLATTHRRDCPVHAL